MGVRERAKQRQSQQSQVQQIAPTTPRRGSPEVASKMDLVNLSQTPRSTVKGFNPVETSEKFLRTDSERLYDDVSSYIAQNNVNIHAAQKFYSDPSKYNNVSLYGIDRFNKNKVYRDYEYGELMKRLTAQRAFSNEPWINEAMKALQASQSTQNNVAEFLKSGEAAYYAQGHYKNNPDNKMSDEEIEKRMNELLNQPVTLQDRLNVLLKQSGQRTSSLLGKLTGNTENPIMTQLENFYYNPDLFAESTQKIELEKAIGSDVENYRFNTDEAKYNAYRNNPDFAEKSYGIIDNKKYYANRFNDESNKAFGVITQPFEDVERKLQTRHMTKDEKKMYYYIYNTQGYDSAEEYYKHIESGLNRKMTDEFNAALTDYTKAHPVYANAFSFATNLGSGFGYVDDTVKMFTGENIDTNNIYHLPANATSTIRNTTEGMLNSDLERFLYGTGMSIGDVALSASLGNILGAPQLASVFLSTSAATNTVIDAKNRGLSDSQAYLLGTISGAAEYATEKMSLDNLFDNLIGGKTTIKEIMKQMAIEGTEEALSSSVNLVADIIISKDKSHWELSITKYMNEGMSREEAIKQAVKDEAKNIALDFAGGAISGGVMGGGVYSYNNLTNIGYNNQLGKQIVNNNQTDNLYSLTGMLDRGSSAYRLSSKVNLDNKSKVGKLYRESYIQAEKELKDNTDKIVAQRLLDLKEDASTVPEVATAIRKAMYGEQLTELESNMLYVSPNARKVMGEFKDAVSGKASPIKHDSIDVFNKISSLSVNKNMDTGATVNKTKARTRIVGIKSVDEKGNIIYNLENGDTAKTKELSMDDDFSEQIEKAVSDYGIVGADAFIKMYNGEDFTAYSRSFDTMFKQGKNDPDGKLENDVMNSASAKILNTAQNKAAYEAGRVYAQNSSVDTQQELDASEARSLEVANIAQKAPQKTIGNVNVANVRSESLTPKQNASIKVMSEISKVTGGTLKMVAFESLANADGIIEDSNGWYDAKTNTLYFDINAGIDNEKIHGDLDRAILRTGGHELTHFIQNMSPEYYTGLKGFIVDTLNSADPNRTEQLISAKLKALPKLSYDKALDEVIADSCEMLLRDSNTIKKLARENMTLAQKIKAWIDDFVKNIRKAFEGVSAKSLEAKQLEIILGDMTKLQNMWDEALEDAIKTSAAGAQQSKIQTAVDTEADEKFLSNFKKAFDEGKKVLSKGTENRTQGEVEVDNGSSEVYSKRQQTKKKSSVYKEYDSLAMKWANEADRAEGDTKIFCKNGRDFRLLEADGNGGFVELARGNYRKVAELYDEIEEEVNRIRKDIRSNSGKNGIEHGRNSRNSVIYEDGLNDGRNYSTPSGEKLQSNSSGNNEHNRTGDKGKSVKYSKRIIEDDFLSTENRAQQNARSSINWVYKAEIFSVTENKMFHQKISEINQGSEAFEQNADGEYMLPIENKIVFTDGDYDTPYISKIIEVMTDSATKFEDAKGVIFDVEKGRQDLREAAQLIENVQGKGYIIQYKSSSDQPYEWTNGKQKGKNRRAVIERYQRLQNRRGNDTEGRGTESVDNDILFSYRSTQIDGRYLAREIKRDYLSTISIENLQSVIDSLAKAQERINTSDDYEQLYSAARSFAEKILANSNMLDDVNAEKAEELERLKSYFSGMRFKVTPEMRSEIEQDFGDYQTFRNAMFGKRIYFSANAQYSLDSTWSEICENFPELFDEDTNPGDQPRALFDAFNSFYVRKGINSNASEYSDMIDSLTNKIIDNLPLQSEAETQEIDTSNFTHRELLRNALSTVAQNDTERDFLARYQREIKDVEKKYEEVAKLRRQIHDISFTKGSDRSQLPAIKNRVAILEDQIQRTDKKLLQLEATKALKDVVEREKKTAVKKANERNKQTFERYKSRKRSSEVREKIKSLHKDLVKSLLYPTDKNYIPPYLVKSMVDVCNAIDFSTDRTGPDGGKTKAQEQREKIVASLNLLRNNYDKLDGHDKNIKIDPNYRSEYDKAISVELLELVESISNSRVGDMTETQLQAVYQSLKTIQGTLRDAKKQIGMEEGRANAEIGLAIIEEQRQIDRKKKGVKKLGQKYSDLIAWNTVSPMRNILRISGYDKNSELYQLAEQLNEGQRKKDIFVMESHKMFEHLIDGKENKKKYQDAIGKAHDFGVVDVDGNAVEMSKMTAMQLVMSWEREMASDGKHSHLQQSGAIIPNHKLLMDGKISEAVSAEHAQRIEVTEGLIKDIVEQFDDWDTEYMEVAHKFFDEKSKNALNETSRVVSHRDVALSEKYIPYKVDEDFVFKKEISDENHIRPTLLSMGMLKDTVRNAGQPLVMTSLNHVLDTQIEQVGAYYGLAIPVRNFNKVWNFTSDNRISVRESITKNWGENGMSVIDQAIRDLQADRVKDRDNFINKALNTANSAFVRSVLNSNISVTLKQLSALPSAYSVLNQRFVPGAVYGHFLKMCVPAKYNKTIKEIDNYTAAHWLRRQGLSNQELGEIAKSMGPVKRFNDKIPAALNPTKWIQGMDCLVTASFWDMCKTDVRKQGEFEEGSEEFMQAVADLYNRVIEDTQAVYDTLHRPEVLKTTNALTRQIFMFRSESLQHSGILYEKYGAMLANKNKETVRDFAKTAYAQYSSAMSFAILSLVGAALLHKMNPYRDEDEELTPESIAAEVFNDFSNVIADLIAPIGGAQLQEFIYGKISGNKYSDGSLSVPAVDFINDFIDSVSTLNNAITAEETDNEKIMTAVEDLTFNFAGLFGIPADNVKNIIKTFKLHIDDTVNGKFGSFEAGVDRSNTVNYHRAAEALVEGDMQKYSDVIAELTESGTDQDKIQQGIKNQLKEFYLDGQLNEQQAIKLLAKYGGDDDENDAYFTVKSWKEPGGSFSKYGDLREAISSGGDIDSTINELLTHGYTEDEVNEEISKATKEAYKKGDINENSVRKIFSGYLGKDDSEIYWLLDELNYYKSNPSAESGDYQKYGDLFTVIDQGGSADIAGTVKVYMDNGVSKKSISSTLTKKYKDKYIELYYSDKTAAANLKNSLLRAYYAAGYNWNNKSKDIDAWLKQS